MKFWFYVMILWSATASTRGGQSGAQPAGIRYTLTVQDPHTHYMEVEAVYPSDGLAEIELMMAVWTPGSYLIREYARHVEHVTASDVGGETLTVRKTAKNRWAVVTRGVSEVVVRYRVYCREMSVRTNWVDEDFASLNGAPTFMTLADLKPRPHDVRIHLPPGWGKSITGLSPHPSGKAHHYRAEYFDILVDTPILLGNPAVYSFEVGGKPHHLINQGEDGVWDGLGSAADVEQIVRQQFKFWEQLPYDRYYFLNVIAETGGGLEHHNSTLMMTSRWRSRIRKDYLGWLGLVSHEFFHTWNVKRLRPLALGPFDYEREVHTKSLWVVEGITSYYDDLLVHRTGLSKQKEYLEQLSKQIERLQTTPGRKVHPLDMTSYDAWIKYYRRDENTPNSTVSYYTKGALVGFLLDARIRHATGDRNSLDDVMRLAYARYSGQRGFSEIEFREMASQVAGIDLSSWLVRVLETTEELDYQVALDWYGLRFKDPEAKPEKDEGESHGKRGDDANSKEDETPGWLGLETRVDSGRLVITQVRRETPAFEFGFNVGDEILAINDFRVPADQWEDRLKQYRPGDRASVLLARRQRVMRREVVFGEEPKKVWQLEVRSDATEAQKEALSSWLGGNES